MYIYTPLCRYWITLYRYVLVFIVPHVDIELEDNKQFISNIPRMPRPMKGTLANSVDTDQTPQNVASDQGLLFTFNTEISYKKVTMKITIKTPF